MVDLNIDDHDAALGLFLSRGHRRPRTLVTLLDRQLDPSLLVAPPLFFFALEDFFDDPGIQHGDHLFSVGEHPRPFDYYVTPNYCRATTDPSPTRSTGPATLLF